MKTKLLATIGVIAVAAAALTGCSAGTAAKTEASCTNKIVNKTAPQVTVWAWYPAFEEVVDLFNKTHEDVQVCWTNAGQGNDEYTKFSTAIESKSGAPDVVMLESEVLSSFTIRKALVDLTEFGANDVKANYTDGSWKDASSGDSVYAIPVDGGPMGMLYRKDLFDKYSIPVPTTWAEFETAAQTLKTAGSDGVLVNFPTNGRAFNQALFAQAGSVPFVYDSTSPTDVGIAVNDQGSKDVLNYWNGLVQKGLVTTDDAFTADYNTSLVDGTYAVYLAAAWGPGYLQGLSDADADAVWRVAPLPQWDAANPVQVNWGGSTFAVTSQATDKKLAAEVAIGIFGTDEAWKIGVEKGALFPSYTPMLDSDYFTNLEYPFFGGQQINKEVFLNAAAGYTGATFSPFQNYAYDQLTEELYSMVQGEQDGSKALDDLQASLVKYATEQGFTVAK
ncbi:ABC transporter substrate-binding protein [Cryobacterium mannosilyticum]|uniref:Extracellular solute-binding protein n=1 Tax=Cryobacterium mannosilyticum TaxID=1259190 RepID=A0A4V3ICY7_9MICO|nr:extracellular solute-binding protein [Cryobacterium mannosilyticum]TFC03788.1 extracellular solute-binding protein [Cryobacterium mannosilyticum]